MVASRSVAWEQRVFKWIAASAAAVVVLPLVLLSLAVTGATADDASTSLACGSSALALSDLPSAYLRCTWARHRPARVCRRDSPCTHPVGTAGRHRPLALPEYVIGARTVHR